MTGVQKKSTQNTALILNGQTKIQVKFSSPLSGWFMIAKCIMEHDANQKNLVHPKLRKKKTSKKIFFFLLYYILANLCKSVYEIKLTKDRIHAQSDQKKKLSCFWIAPVLLLAEKHHLSF